MKKIVAFVPIKLNNERCPGKNTWRFSDGTPLMAMIQRALNPAKISSITIDEEKKTASVYLKPDQVSLAIGKGGLNIRLSKMLTGYDIDVYREVEEEDVALTEFADEIDGWIIDALKAAGCDTAKSVLELPVEEIAARADLELEQAQKVVEILKAEFEE